MKKLKQVTGWIGVAITVIISSTWAYWGTIENFHEGWYATSIWENIVMLLFQYLSFTIIFMSLALVILRWKRVGLILHAIVGVFCIFFFKGANFSVLGLLIILPFILIGLLYYYGEPKPKKWAYLVIITIPLVIIILIAIPKIIMVSSRIDDGNLGTRIVAGNDITLVWAPRGPGWPEEGTSWEEANEICRYLSEDGTVILPEEQNIWRLPTVDEAVRSMQLHGENAGGIWNPVEESAEYRVIPDKESPLWDVHSKVIYYWTSETSATDQNSAYIIVYDGGVYDKLKTSGQDYLSFRAVKIL
jgi:hypothetical protein